MTFRVLSELKKSFDFHKYVLFLFQSDIGVNTTHDRFASTAPVRTLPPGKISQIVQGFALRPAAYNFFCEVLMPGGFPSQIVHAATNGCPFCRSLFHLVPEVGEAVIFVTGSSIGSCGLVVPVERTHRPGDFWVSTGPASATIHMCNADYDRAIPVGAYDVPPWMAPLCMEDSAFLHAALADCFLLPADPSQAEIEDAVIAAVSCCWGHRLPVTSQEIWALLAGHNAHPGLQERITSRFDFGMTLMTRLKGRKPNQRRRMPAMSRIRYLTPHNEPLWVNLKGYSNLPQVVCLPDGTLNLTPEGYERVSIRR